MDFGFEESYNALVYCVVDDAKKDLYIMDVIYKNKTTDPKFVKDIEHLKDKWIVADCA